MQGTGVPRTVEAPARALSCGCRLIYGSDAVDRSPCGCVPVTGRWQHSDAVLRVCSRAEVVSCQPVAGAGRVCLCAHGNDTMSVVLVIMIFCLVATLCLSLVQVRQPVG